MDPMFSLYSGMYKSCAIAAEKQWGSKGIWIPETVYFDGPEVLPDKIFAEMQELYLVRKPWEQASKEFRYFGETKQLYNSQWNFQTDGHWDHGHWIVPDKKMGAFGHTSHIMADGAKIATLFWDRYQYTLDRDWLRDRAYPMIRAPPSSIATSPTSPRTRTACCTLPTSTTGKATGIARTPSWNFRRCTSSSPSPSGRRRSSTSTPTCKPCGGSSTTTSSPRPRRGSGRASAASSPAAGAKKAPTAAKKPTPIEEAAVANDRLKARYMEFTMLGGFTDPPGIGGAHIFRNRLRLREGPGAIDAEHIGALTYGVHLGLLESVGTTPGADPLIQVFPAWPEDWDAQFTLLARGNFLVISSQRKGKTEFVELVSQGGEDCNLKNPWGDAAADVYRRGAQTETVSGHVLNFKTRKGETILVVRGGASPEQFRRAVP